MSDPTNDKQPMARQALLSALAQAGIEPKQAEMLVASREAELLEETADELTRVPAANWRAAGDQAGAGAAWLLRQKALKTEPRTDAWLSAPRTTPFKKGTDL
jgi:hypothetical protein